MVLVAWISHYHEKIGVTGWASDILGWACTGAINTCRNFWDWIKGEGVLARNLVMPLIAEVIKIGQAPRGLPIKIGEANDCFVEEPWTVGINGFVDSEIAKSQAADLKFMQMSVAPSKGGLNDVMQMTEVKCRWNNKPPPDRGFNLEDANAKLQGVRRFKKVHWRN
jgi:hypothetical protein